MSIPDLQVPTKIAFTKKDGTKEIFLRHEELGQGGFSSVFRATQQNTNNEYAIKVISKKFLNSKGEVTLKRLINEMKIQKSLNHPNIVKSKCNFSDEFNYYIVLEHCPGKSIRDYLKKSDNGFLNEAQTRKILRDVIKGLVYLHNNNIIHHDIKLENFLIGVNGIIKIADFGISTVVTKDDQKPFSICGTINYMSPEVLKRKSHSFEVDIWAIGVAAFIMLTGKAPFCPIGSIKKDSIYENIKNCTYSFPPYPQMSSEAKNFIKSTLRLNPSDRPTASQLLDHPFLTKFDKELIDFFAPIQLFQKVKSVPVFQNVKDKQPNLKVQPLLQSDSDSESDTSTAIQKVQTLSQKARAPTPSQSYQKVQTLSQKARAPTPSQSYQKVQPLSQKARAPTPSQKAQLPLPPSSQKVRSPTPSRYSQKSDQNDLNAANASVLRKISSTSKLRSSSVSTLRTTKPPVPTGNSGLVGNNIDLIRSSSSYPRKSSVGSPQKKFFTVPSTFVAKYYMHGETLGYLLGNGTVGVCYNCVWDIVMDPTETFAQYHACSGDSSFECVNLAAARKTNAQKDPLYNKVALLLKFAKVLKKNMLQEEPSVGGEGGSNSQEKTDSTAPLLHVRYFLPQGESFLFKFSDRNIQVNFGDRSKMAIFWSAKKACFFRSVGEKCALLQLNEMAAMDAGCEERQKFRSAKMMLAELSKKVQGLAKH